MKQSVS